MIGWHYTSLENYQLIVREGLKLYPLRKEFHYYYIREGIWLYTEQQEGLSHLACVGWQCFHKHTQDVVLLQVSYGYRDRITPSGLHTVTVSHDLYDYDYGPRVYFHRQQPATVIFTPVPPERIQLISTTHVEDINYLTQELRKAA